MGQSLVICNSGSRLESSGHSIEEVPSGSHEGLGHEGPGG